MADGDNSGGGGGLLGLDPNLLMNLGVGLLSSGAKNSPLRGNVGLGLAQGLQGYQQQRAANQQYQMGQMQMGLTRAQFQAEMPIYQALGQKLHEMNNDPATPMHVQGLLGGPGSQPQGAPPGTMAPPAGPAGAALGGASQPPTAPASPQGPDPRGTSPYQPLPPLPSVGGNPASNIELGTMLQALPQFKGYGEALTNEPSKLQAAQEQQVKQRQLGISQPLAALDTIMTSADADKRLQKDPDLFGMWNQENGDQPLTPPAARAFAGTLYNRLASSAQLPSKPIPTMLQTTQRGNGESIQTDPITGKVTAGAPDLATDKFIKNGQVVELPKAQGIAQGLTPYDSSLYGAEQITPEAKEQAYQVAKTKGDLTEAVAGRDPVAQAQLASYIAQRAKQDNLSGVALAAQGQAFKASQLVLNDFRDPNGKAGGKLNAINMTVAHSQVLLPLIDAMQSGNLTKINAAKQAYQEATGKTAPGNYQLIANLYSQEAVNAITAAGGDKDERSTIAAPYAAIRSPAQLKDAVTYTAQALAGKTEALRNQWDNGTQGLQGSFDQMLLPATKAALAQSGGGTPQHPKAIQDLLKKYQKNAKPGSQ